MSRRQPWTVRNVLTDAMGWSALAWTAAAFWLGTWQMWRWLWSHASRLALRLLGG